MKTNLDQIVLVQLEASRGHWQAVALAAGVSHSWLSKFANGHIPNPGYATLTRLYKTLELAQSPANTQHPAAQAAGQGV